jgi:hypothetical protein
VRNVIVREDICDSCGSGGINTYKPAVIIAETDEEDSNQAFSSRAVDIDTYADSIKYFTINKWKLKLIWLNQSRFNYINTR